MITVTAVGMQKLVARVSAMPNNVHKALLKKITFLSLKMERRIKQKLSGEVLNVRTGDLRRSIHHEIEDGPTAIYGIVFSTGGRSKQPPYAEIHEKGGTIQHPGGTPYLNFHGKTYFVSKQSAIASRLPVTKAHAIRIPARPYMSSTFGEMKQEIVSGLQEAAREGVRKV